MTNPMQALFDESEIAALGAADGAAASVGSSAAGGADP